MDLTLYSATWCRDCREAKRFLTTHSIPFKEIDIETTPGAAAQGFVTAPGHYAPSATGPGWPGGLACIRCT